MDERVLRELLQLETRGERAVLATVVRTRGSAPQGSGARLLWTESGRLVGTVGGGSIERAVVERAKRVLQDGGAPELVEFDLGADLAMACGGAMDVFLELIAPRPRLVIFGAGHVGREVAEIASRLGFERWVVDDRAEYASEERFPGCRLLVQPFAEVARSFEPQNRDYLLIVTHGHRHDDLLLQAFVQGPQKYLGMIGSKTKVAEAFARLRASSVPEEAIARVHSPVGLPIGALTPAEIGVSIVAELVQELRRIPDGLQKELYRGQAAE